MLNEKIYLQRIEKFTNELWEKRYSDFKQLKASYIYDKINVIPYEKAIKADFKEIKLNEKWGELWGCAWFKFQGKVPENFAGKTVGVDIELNGEACVFKEGTPWVGLTNKVHWNHLSGKNYVPLFDVAKGGEEIDLLVEAGANGLFGGTGKDFTLERCDIVVFEKDIMKLYYDVKCLLELAKALEENTPRRNKIIRGLNNALNIWNDGKGILECLEITANLLSSPANASSCDVYSIGHAHIDLAWLWPVRETRRKSGRTFSTVLKYMEEYPQYKFGASQPQQYKWVKQDYPKLYEKIKKAVKDGRWELQGAMWCEPDMNLTSGESLVRQCIYGKKFFKEEFGKDVRNLWLPDVFGYSAALPQILKKSGIDVFMTQKISWNETNTFPHHTFYWQGIDGTKILTHFLPTNDYNLNNFPDQMIASEKRFAQSDVSGEFLNLYGIGDGGGGPSRFQIEMATRQQNLEGVPKIKFEFAEKFFEKISQIPEQDLPLWVGELYLELHRGTYTTQGLIKKHNRLLEQRLRKIEFLGVIFENYDKATLDQIWEDTLLNQFHDILPGSSINWVYKDANALSIKNLNLLSEIEKNIIEQKFGTPSDDTFIIYNANSWNRTEVIKLPAKDGNYFVIDAEGKSPCIAQNGFIEYQINIPSMSWMIIKIEKNEKSMIEQNLKADIKFLENEVIRVSFAEDGTISSIYDKEIGRETIKGKANVLNIWEDKPNNWGAWDVNHFYRETKPEQAKLISSKVLSVSPVLASIEQKLSISNSIITQKISIERGSKLVKIHNTVNWKEVHKMLRVSADVNIFAEEASYEIQFGTLKRPNHMNTSWERAKFEVCGHRFADLSQPDYGIALLNDCKYGYYIQGNTLDLNLLRSPHDTDKDADQHIHEFTFAYYPHMGSLIYSDSLQIAHDLNSPLEVFSIASNNKLQTKSLYHVNNPRIKIETIKKAESTEDVIVRLYNTTPANEETVFSVPEKFNKIQEVNLIEEKMDFEAIGNRIKLDFKPFEIRSFLLQ